MTHPELGDSKEPDSKATRSTGYSFEVKWKSPFPWILPILKVLYEFKDKGDGFREASPHHDWWVLLSLPRHPVVGWKCAVSWFIFIHGPASLYAQNKILLLFAPITLKRINAAESPTWILHWFVFEHCCLLERDRSKCAEITLGNLSSDFYYYCCPEAVSQDNSQPDLTQVPKQPCNSRSLQFCVLDQGYDITVLQFENNHTCWASLWTLILISIRQFIYQILQRHKFFHFAFWSL